ncbi:unnamed protein product [Mucor circinelloides]|uniref:Uncharacterized protein n=1 Tax=Mucor circinelloides f. circinelloides (strain 1006PhL) TaxID=1220926 RepID=S2JFT8_MUCC1|nr:hypothetical protein HMPREF1544_04033 [Mucor circinelloides 1006PhL]
MVNVTTFMIATTAMVMGINALDVNAAEQIKMGLEEAQVIPASASEYAAEAASASVSDVYKAAVESVLVQAAIVKAENNNNGEVHLAADNIFNDIIADFGKFIEGLLHPSIDLPSVDLPSVDLPNVNLPSASVGLNIGSPLSLSVAQTPKSTPKPTPEPTPKGKLQLNKRAIYDMDGSYSESSASESEASNEYSAQDFYPASASASASEAYYLPHAASVKAVLKARRSEAYASASARASASASASAFEAAISAAPEMWDQVMVRRSAEAEVSEEEDQIYSEAQLGFIGDLIGDRIKDEIGKNIASEIGKNIQSEIGKNIASAISNIPKSSIDFDALRSSLVQQFSSSSSSEAPSSSASSAAESSSTTD